MRLLELMRRAAKNIFRKRAQAILTILGISIGVFSVLLISTIGTVGRDAINTELEGLGFDCITVSAVRDDLNTLDAEALAEVGDLDGVRTAAPLMTKMGQVIMRQYVGEALVCGVDQNAADIITLSFQNGRFLRKSDISAASNVCVVDEKLAVSYYKRTNIVGKTLELTIGGVTESFEIIGVVDSEGSALRGMAGDYIPSFVYIPYTAFQRMTHRSAIDQMFVKVSGQADSKTIGEAITAALDIRAGYHNLYQYQDLAAQKDRLDAILQSVTVILSAIGAVSLVVSGLSIMTIMIVSVQDRTREIGIKKAIGAKKRSILAEFLVESLWITMLGSVCGIAVSLLVVMGAGLLLGIPLGIGGDLIAKTILFSSLIGILFGVYPAKLAASLKPVDALRHE